MKKSKLISLINGSLDYAKNNSGKNWEDLCLDKNSIAGGYFLRDGSNTNDETVLLDIVPVWGDSYDNLEQNGDDPDWYDDVSSYKEPWKAPLKVAINVEDWGSGESYTLVEWCNDEKPTNNDINMVLDTVNA